MTRGRSRSKSASSRDAHPEVKYRASRPLPLPRLYGREDTPRQLQMQARYAFPYTPEGGFPWAGSCFS